MVILLDGPIQRIRGAQTKWPSVSFGQLLTPLTGYTRVDTGVIGIDNGAFSRPVGERFWSILEKNKGSKDIVFVAMPDVVANAAETLRLFYVNLDRALIYDLPLAFVLQDGVIEKDIPWEWIGAVFVGGSTEFKQGRDVLPLIEQAKERGLWVHVGRVNTVNRVKWWVNLADSIDGSGISRFTNARNKVAGHLSMHRLQQGLFDEP